MNPKSGLVVPVRQFRTLFAMHLAGDLLRKHSPSPQSLLCVRPEEVVVEDLPEDGFPPAARCTQSSTGVCLVFCCFCVCLLFFFFFGGGGAGKQPFLGGPLKKKRPRPQNLAALIAWLLGLEFSLPSCCTFYLPKHNSTCHPFDRPIKMTLRFVFFWNPVSSVLER